MEDDPGIGLFLTEALAGSRYFEALETAVSLADKPTVDDLYTVLARTIEREVVPRLLLNTRIEIARRNADRLRALNRKERDVPRFCEIILENDLEDARTYITNEIAEGASRESILLDLLAPTARHLGELWDLDERSFVEVTLALGKLHQVLRMFSETDNAPAPAKMGFSALLATMPNSTHVFGLLVVEELFRQAGWMVLSIPSPRHNELLRAVAQEWFAVVGLSISCDDGASSVMSLIADIRAASLNRSVFVLIGGRYVVDNPDAAMFLGADLVGTDAQDAIERSQFFMQSIGRL